MLNKKAPLISLVMVNYNGLNYLKKTIKPILNLNYPNYEFIIVDNGSNDGSIQYINSFKRIKLIKSPKFREKNFACNYAIKKSKGTYILLLDNDALIHEKNILGSLIEESEKINDFGCFSISYHNPNENILHIGLFLSYFLVKIMVPKYFIKNKKNLHLIKISAPLGISIFIKKETWSKINGYDSATPFGAEDIDLGIKIILLGLNNYSYTKSIMTHLGMPERKDNKKYCWKFKNLVYSNLYLILKNYSTFNTFLSLFFYSFFAFFKSIKQSIKRKNICPFFSFFQGYYLFLKNMAYGLKKRKEIQLKRIIKKDIFLKIMPPKIN